MVCFCRAQDRAEATRAKLIETATDLVRRRGYNATAVDDICKAAGITKGAFFHHFRTKESLVEACMGEWDRRLAAMEAAAAFQKSRSPRKRVAGYMDLIRDVFSNPEILKSCPIGTTVQEAAETNPALRAAAKKCFENAGRRFQILLDEADGPRKKMDTASLAALWMATLQGSMLLYKATGDGPAFPQEPGARAGIHSFATSLEEESQWHWHRRYLRNSNRKRVLLARFLNAFQPTNSPGDRIPSR
ncbi:MAG: TetR/AcrR family transcriptional regulator [Acidobacteriota bacterium]